MVLVWAHIVSFFISGKLDLWAMIDLSCKLRKCQRKINPNRWIPPGDDRRFCQLTCMINAATQATLIFDCSFVKLDYTYNNVFENETDTLTENTLYLL